MKKRLFASLLLLAACNAKPADQATTTSPAPAAAPADVDLDLTRYGVPLTMRVPLGVAVAKDARGRVVLTAPRYSVEITTAPADDAATLGSQHLFAQERDEFIKEKATVLLDEPLLLYISEEKKNKTHYMWSRAVLDPAAKKIYLMGETEKTYNDTTLTKADHDRMMKSSRTAHLTAGQARAAAGITAPAVGSAELDLTRFGTPITIQVPAGTRASPVSHYTEAGAAVLLKGPGLLLNVSLRTGNEAKALTQIKQLKQLTTPGDKSDVALTDDDGTQLAVSIITLKMDQITVDEPLVVRVRKKDNPSLDAWVRDVVYPGDKYCLIEMPMEVLLSDSGYTTADREAMFAIARTARPTTK